MTFIAPPDPYGSPDRRPDPYRGRFTLPGARLGLTKDTYAFVKACLVKAGLDWELGTGDGYKTVHIYSRAMTTEEIVATIIRGFGD